MSEVKVMLAEINRLKMKLAKIEELVPRLVAVTATPNQPPEVADMVRCHNAAVDELLLLCLQHDDNPIQVYGHDPEPSMAIDAATLEVHDEY